jgi:hypothetical protein
LFDTLLQKIFNAKGFALESPQPRPLRQSVGLEDRRIPASFWPQAAKMKRKSGPVKATSQVLRPYTRHGSMKALAEPTNGPDLARFQSRFTRPLLVVQSIVLINPSWFNHSG